MLLALQIIFWSCVFGLLHSYLFYPFILQILSRNKKQTVTQNWPINDLPIVSVIMAVYNEEKVIEEKVESLLALDYPINKINIYVGSDCSSDQTNKIMSSYAQKYERVHFSPFTNRNGKPGVVNKLVDIIVETKPVADNHIFLMTDASVMLDKQTLNCLVRHFQNPEITIVDANMKGIGIRSAGISKSENQYVGKEVLMKNREGLIWQKMVGPFGGCYAMRSTAYHKVPTNFLVDDFYITMKVFEDGGKAINDLEAVCYEAVSHEVQEEYRRKARISAGNFQNLQTFKHLLWPPYKGLGFAFLSHKVLRWLGPFFILIILVINCILAYKGVWLYQLLLLLQICFLFVIPLLDNLLKKMNVHIHLLRSISYFNMMNLALLEGFFNYLKGIKKGTWEPTKRS